MNNVVMINGSLDAKIDAEEVKCKKVRSGRSKRRLRESKEVVQREVVQILPADTDSCVSIWHSVIIQAFYDLLSESDALEQRLDRAEAVAWFGQGVENEGDEQTDFSMVCEMANLDPFAVMKLAREVIRGDKKEMRQKIVSGFNFRTLRRDSSSRTPKKDKKTKSGE